MPQSHEIQIQLLKGGSQALELKQRNTFSIFFKKQNKTNIKKTHEDTLSEPGLRTTDLVDAQETIHTKMSVSGGFT